MKYLITTFLTALGLTFFAGCTEEDEYRKFLEGGEIYYPGKIEQVQVFSGKERVRLFGLFISDPKVTKCKVYWNIRQDSVVFPVSRTNLIDTLDEIVEVEEGIHNFEFFTMDDKGHKSVVVNATGQSYGANFESQLNNRPIVDASYDDSLNVLTIDWAGMDLSTGAYETEVQYNLTTNTESIRVPISETLTTITGCNEAAFRYRTFFRPDSLAIDNFWTEFDEIKED